MKYGKFTLPSYSVTKNSEFKDIFFAESEELRKGEDTPFLEFAKEVCKDYKHDEMSKLILDSYCKSTQITKGKCIEKFMTAESMECFKLFYIEGFTAENIVDYIYERDCKNYKRGLLDYIPEPIDRRTVFKRIHKANKGFAQFLHHLSYFIFGEEIEQAICEGTYKGGKKV